MDPLEFKFIYCLYLYCIYILNVISIKYITVASNIKSDVHVWKDSFLIIQKVFESKYLG